MSADFKDIELIISSNAESAAREAASGFAGAIEAAVKARGVCTLALSGGRSPLGMLAALARPQVPWASVHIFQVDERVVPAGSDERNWTHLHECLISQIDIPSQNVHPMPLNARDLQQAAREYANELAAIAGRQPVIDVVHLGLGGDGHTASLAPGDPVLKELSRDVAVTEAFQGHRRITLTYPCLRRARQLFWFVTGADKATALKDLRHRDERSPAGRLRHDRNVIYADRSATQKSPILAIDVGGSHVKLMDSVHRQRRRFQSGQKLSAKEMCDKAIALASDWDYAAVSIGVPAPVRDNRVVSEPPNLGPGWVGFDFADTFSRPSRIMNDAAMQALGSYQGGKMLFLGLGTGLGSALIAQKLIIPMELAHLPYRDGASFEDYVGERGLHRLGKREWRGHVAEVATLLRRALLPDEVILGGGNVRHFDELPEGCRRGNNEDAFLGGFRLWEQDYVVL